MPVRSRSNSNFEVLVFEGKTGVPEEKPLGARERTNNKLNPHMASTLEFEPVPHWWEASALTTASHLLPVTLHLSRREFKVPHRSFVLQTADDGLLSFSRLW